MMGTNCRPTARLFPLSHPWEQKCAPDDLVFIQEHSLSSKEHIRVPVLELKALSGDFSTRVIRPVDQALEGSRFLVTRLQVEKVVCARGHGCPGHKPSGPL